MRLAKIYFSIFFALYAIRYTLYATPAAAQQQEFSSRFRSAYNVSAEGIATVTHSIELENLLSKIYASEYTLTIGSTRIKNVTAQVSGKSIPVTTKTDDNSTEIHVTFPDPVIGQNKILRLEVTYTNLDIAQKSGRVLEVNIPRLAGANDLAEYTVFVSVPDSFDQPTLMSPPTTKITTEGGKRTITFNKDQITQKGISILFGDHQVYDFTLSYTIQNLGVTKTTTAIALPPDTPYQQVFYEAIDPKPENVVVDPDGNWLAEYPLSSQETKNITATGKAVLYLNPTVPVKPTTAESSYLSPLPLWQVDDPDIISFAQRLKTPENIYNYLVDNFDYNYGRIDASSPTDRLGAKLALENPQNAICTEFTDAFVALARAAGIPARSVDGFAYTTNSRLRPLSLKLDVLHAWPEFYDSKFGLWHPVDPTWGNTTQGIDYFSRWDLNHFTFTIHGLDSRTPYPAGAYKLSAAEGKDVQVAFSFDEPIFAENISVTIISPKISLPGNFQEITLTIENRGPTALHQPAVAIVAPGYTIEPTSVNLTTIPPYGEIVVLLTLHRQRLIPTTNILNVKINNHESTFPLAENGLGYPEFIQTFATALMGGILALTAYLTGRLLVRRRQS